MNPAIQKENNLHKREAFTLIELITVIGIIGILAAIFFPAIRMVMEKGKETACANNMRQWGTALGMYLDDQRGVFPTDGASAVQGGGKEIDRNWYNVLPPYIGLESFNALKTQGQAPCPGIGKSLYICPSQRIDSELLAKYTSGEQRAYHLSYAMNSWINAGSKSMRLSLVKHPDQLVVFSESSDKSPETVNASSADFRHRDRVNVVFVDGHVAPVLKKYVNDVQWDPRSEPGKASASGE